MENIQPVEDDLEDLKDKYPVGTIVSVESEGGGRIMPENFNAVVTGHSVVESGKRFTPVHPGPRVNVSTNPPGFEHLDEKKSGAAALRPCEIDGIVGVAKPTDD